MTFNKMGIESNYGLENHGFRNLNMVHWTLTTSALVDRIISRKEGLLAQHGAVVVRTGSHTGRSPNDKFIVHEEETGDKIWWGTINRPLGLTCFNHLYMHMRSYFQGRDVFVQDTTAVSHPEYQLPIRVISETAWHSLFTRNLFIKRSVDDLPTHKPEFTIIHAPSFQANPEEDGTNSEAFVVINFQKRLILIGGTSYAGEIKKSIFTVLNYLLPQKGVLPMHCSANVGEKNDMALFFGLSGTGKTTLSSDPDRYLIGDDEHGWGDDGIFNFEGGCYAKTINLREEFEPLIWSAARRFGVILENVTVDSYSRKVDYDDSSLTENTRAAYPVDFLNNIVSTGQGPHPINIFFLTADAFGVIPPIARLTIDQAIYFFLSGYTSKLAGTETGVTEPQVTFSTCFGAPFLPLHPKVYADLLRKKIEAHKSQVWLVNTGWTGGPYGEGSRIKLPYTRSMVSAVLKGDLNDAEFHKDPVFDIDVPDHVKGVPDDLLNPRTTWAHPDSFDQKARELTDSFEENFAKFESQEYTRSPYYDPCG